MYSFGKKLSSWLAPVLGAGAIGVCPLCWAGSASLLTYIGLGAVVSVWPVVVLAFLGIALVGFVFDYKSHRRGYPLILLIVGGVLLLVGRYVVGGPNFGGWPVWGSGTIVIIASIYSNRRLFQKPVSGSGGETGAGTIDSASLGRGAVIGLTTLALVAGAAMTFFTTPPANSSPADPPIINTPYKTLPAINAYYNGKQIWFLHTDVSDPAMVKKLTQMVKYPTTYSSLLGQVPAENVGKLYVFTNGVLETGTKPWGGGPFGYQIDIFDSVPGDPNYTPLRQPQLVTWQSAATPRPLTSVADLLAAEKNGEVVITPTDAIVNAPIIN